MNTKNFRAGIYEIPRKSPHLWKIRKSLRAHLDKNQHYVLGLSGGVDSLALGAALSIEGYNVTAVIINHQLQDNHEEFTEKARQNAVNLGLNVEVVKVDVPETRQGMEAEARKARYTALGAYNKPVLIAHTMNDQVETVLMALGKNTGINSLTGMQVESTIMGVDLVRPMLHYIQREDTQGACEELGIDWWEDPQNNDTSYRRVAVRKQLIPTMKEVFGYNLIERLSETFNEVSKYKNIVDNQTTSLFNDNHTPYMLHTESLLEENEVIIKGVIVEFLKEYNVYYNKAGIEDIYKMIVNYKGQGAVNFKNYDVTRHSKNIIMLIPKEG